MRCEEAQRLLSSFVDGELPRDALGRVKAHLQDCPGCETQVSSWRRLSSVLQVPQRLSDPDPGFLVRFRERRDRVAASTWMRQPWKWLAVRLVPITAATLVAAGAVLWLNDDEPSPFRQLERNELGQGLAQVTEEPPVLEPVLGISLGDLSRGLP